MAAMSDGTLPCDAYIGYGFYQVGHSNNALPYFSMRSWGPCLLVNLRRQIRHTSIIINSRCMNEWRDESDIPVERFTRAVGTPK